MRERNRRAGHRKRRNGARRNRKNVRNSRKASVRNASANAAKPSSDPARKNFLVGARSRKSATGANLRSNALVRASARKGWAQRRS